MLHFRTKMDDQTSDEGCVMTKRAEPLYDGALKVGTSLTICKDVEGVDAREDEQNSLA